MIKENISRLKNNISLICCRLGRSPEEITIVAVTKFASAEMIREALASGLRDMGENKVQEAMIKYKDFKGSELRIKRHMVGHLQTNKVKEALKIFDMIDSLDSLKLALEIEKQAVKSHRTVDVLIQVKTSSEPQKFGVVKEATFPLIREISKFEHIRVLGLMTIAPFVTNEPIIRNSFRRLRELSQKVSQEFSGKTNIKMQYLSMGMSSDYPIALEEGANMIRIGRAIFSHA